MTTVLKSSNGRSRAEGLMQETCRYLRNEGYEALQSGDMERIAIVNAAYDKAIRTINIISGVRTAERERLIKEIARTEFFSVWPIAPFGLGALECAPEVPTVITSVKGVSSY